jgi:heme-degrading monooxygenase HmoA
MILEAVHIQVRPGQSSEFESAFLEAQTIISTVPGYISHELHHCVEQQDGYILLVRWQTLKDHEVGFRKSEKYQEWKKLLHHFYDPFPTVLHYEQVAEGNYSSSPTTNCEKQI